MKKLFESDYSYGLDPERATAIVVFQLDEDELELNFDHDDWLEFFGLHEENVDYSPGALYHRYTFVVRGGLLVAYCDIAYNV